VIPQGSLIYTAAARSMPKPRGAPPAHLSVISPRRFLTDLDLNDLLLQCSESAAAGKSGDMLQRAPERRQQSS
jgi:hypothetical protein